MGFIIFILLYYFYIYCTHLHELICLVVEGTGRVFRHFFALILSWPGFGRVLIKVS